MTTFPSPSRQVRDFLLLGLLLSSALHASPLRQAENLQATPFNQLAVSRNSCGPAALLNSFRFGNHHWRSILETDPPKSDRDHIREIIRVPAMRESSSLPGRARWSRNGINLADLTDVANEMRAGKILPALSHETLFLKPGESQSNFIKRVHRRLEKSLAAGFPPVLSIRRFVYRNNQWTAIDGHFITLTAIPKKLGRNDNSFPVTYIDPWGGKIHQGSIRIATEAFLTSDPATAPNLEAVFPHALVGKDKLRHNEKSILALSATLSR